MIPIKRVDHDDDEPLVLDRELRSLIRTSALLYRLAIVALVVVVVAFGPFLYHSLWTDATGHLDRAPKDVTFEQHMDQFVRFKTQFDKVYESVEEEALRFNIFRQSLMRIEDVAQLESDTEFGVTAFADMSDEEFQEMLLPAHFYRQLRAKATFIRPAAQLSALHKLRHKQRIMEQLGEDTAAQGYPPRFDWRERGVVTPVKAQRNCGSCWAFAATATVETSYAIAHGQLRNLSEQELLDCDLANDACNGGDDDKAFRFIHEHGLMLESDYPYMAQRQNSCLLDDFTGPTTKLDLAVFINPDEHAIMEWLVNFGPVNVGINVPPDMKLYKGGVYTPSSWDCQNNILGTHALNIMGYGTWENGQKYWIVKNSWGQQYGIEDGYVYMARGENSCGIEDEPIGVLC